MSTIIWVVMIIAGVGMLVGFSKQKAGVDWGQPVAAICAVIALICALAAVGLRLRGPGGGKAGLKREMAWVKVSGEKLGQYLAKKYPEAKALVIRDPKNKTADERIKALLDGIKQGAGGKITLVAVEAPEIPKNMKGMGGEMGMPGPGGEGGADMTPPTEFWFKAPIFDKLVKKHAGQIDMVITTMGLPSDYGRMKFWKMSKRPKLVLAGGSVYDLKQLFAGKYIAAAVTYNPDAVYKDESPSSDVDKAFDKRYVLITPENLAQVIQKYGSKLFR